VVLKLETGKVGKEKKLEQHRQDLKGGAFSSRTLARKKNMRLRFAAEGKIGGSPRGKKLG